MESDGIDLIQQQHFNENQHFDGITTDRLEVPGGWLYRTYGSYIHDDIGVTCSVATTFVPGRPKDY